MMERWLTGEAPGEWSILILTGEDFPFLIMIGEEITQALANIG